MTTVSYRQESGRLIMRLEGIDLVDRAAKGEFITIALGRAQVDVPLPLDWEPTYEPVKVQNDPHGRVWEQLMWADKGTETELWTPMVTGPA